MREAGAVQFPACADVYLPNAERAREWAGSGAAVYQDFRRLLERKDIDAVLVATPDHWHAGAAVLACQAGKDVYVEKPLAHNIREGRAMVSRRRHAASQGHQHRSAPHYREVERLRSGARPSPLHASGTTPHGAQQRASDSPRLRDSTGFYRPGPRVAFNRRRFNTFRWFRDYAGDISPTDAPLR
jgi:predicted dehydrogenase